MISFLFIIFLPPCKFIVVGHEARRAPVLLAAALGLTYELDWMHAAAAAGVGFAALLDGASVAAEANEQRGRKRGKRRAVRAADEASVQRPSCRCDVAADHCRVVLSLSVLLFFSLSLSPSLFLSLSIPQTHRRGRAPPPPPAPVVAAAEMAVAPAFMGASSAI